MVLAVFLSWLALLLLGFGLLCPAARTSFSPPLPDFAQALYVAGSSLLTVGTADVHATGFARWTVLAAALSGLAVVTAGVTFILQIQESVHLREATVLSVSGLAGRPPCGLALLEAFGAPERRPELAGLFREWQHWSASVMHIHLANPIIVHIHSVDEDGDWLAAFGAVMDAATLVVAMTQDEAAGAASLLHENGLRTAHALCTLLRLRPAAPEEEPSGEEIAARLRRAGFRPAPDARSTERYRALRAEYAGHLASLADHLGALPHGAAVRGD